MRQMTSLIVLCLMTAATASGLTAQTAQQGLSVGVPAGIPSNIKLDLSITDTYGGSPLKKTVSMLIRNGQGGRIRTSNHLPTGIEVKLNVDAQVNVHRVTPTGPSWLTVQVTFEYTPAQSSVEDGVRAHPAQLHESLDVVVLDGKPLMVSQSADPATERRVTVELTATILPTILK